MCGVSEYARRSEWPSALCVDFIKILPIVQPKLDFREAAMMRDSEAHAHAHQAISDLIACQGDQASRFVFPKIPFVSFVYS